jgi:hypothetical protein
VIDSGFRYLAFKTDSDAAHDGVMRINWLPAPDAAWFVL